MSHAVADGALTLNWLKSLGFKHYGDTDLANQKFPNLRLGRLTYQCRGVVCGVDGAVREVWYGLFLGKECLTCDPTGQVVLGALSLLETIRLADERRKS